MSLNNTRKSYGNDEENTFKLILDGSIFLHVSIKIFSFFSIDWSQSQRLKSYRSLKTNPNQTHYWQLSQIPDLASPNPSWWNGGGVVVLHSSSLGGIFSLFETFKMFHTTLRCSCLKSSSTLSLLALKKSKSWGWQVHYTWTPHPFMNVGKLSPPSG